MKELSIEEKAKRYDEAYKVAKNIHIFSSDLAEIKRMEEIFPELKEESEDERIKKRICKILWDNVPYEEAQEYITWLEKQNGQKPVIEMKTPEENLGIDSDTYNKIVDECIYDEQPADKSEPTDYNSIDPYFGKPIDKVEPKFHEGEWIVHHGTENIYQVVAVIGSQYQLKYGDNYTIQYCEDVERCARLWDVAKDAKPGDVLVDQNGEMPFIFKECKNNHIYCYCAYTNPRDMFFDRFVDSEGEELHWLNLYHEQAYPATKEQRDLLFQKMKDTGYEWDAEKKELKKIEQEPAWSEEDERICHSLTTDLSNAQTDDEKVQNEINEEINWLKSIKDRVLPQPKQEWSEEDEVKINRIVACLENLNVADNDILLKDVDWLKSLKDRVGCEVNCTTTKEWKPSDEQMKQLGWIAKQNKDNMIGKELMSLYQDLKKLRDK